jgi:hypothetical protein
VSDLAGLCDNMGAMTMRVVVVVADASAASLHKWWGEEPSSINPSIPVNGLRSIVRMDRHIGRRYRTVGIAIANGRTTMFHHSGERVSEMLFSRLALYLLTSQDALRSDLCHAGRGI